MKEQYGFKDAPRGVLHGKIKTVRGVAHTPPASVTVRLTASEAEAVTRIIEPLTQNQLAVLANLTEAEAQEFLAQAQAAVDKLKAA